MAILSGRPAEIGEGAILFTKRREHEELLVLTRDAPTQHDYIRPPVICLVNGEVVTVETYNLAILAAMDAMESRCRSCHAPICWRKLHTDPNGKANPINPIPDPAGNVVLVGDALYRVIPPIDLKDPRPAGQLRYTSHFVTCPDRAKWRLK